VTEQAYRLDDRIDDAGDILGFSVDGVARSVSAAAAASTVDHDNGEVPGKGRHDRIPVGAVADAAVNEHQWWSGAKLLIGDAGTVRGRDGVHSVRHVSSLSSAPSVSAIELRIRSGPLLDH
jgi:hypothetical protein